MKRIIVFGLGGIGGYIGARLGGAGAGTEVVFIARGAHLAAIRKSGLRFRSPDGREETVKPFLATDAVAEAGKADAVFICTKGYDLVEACRSLVPAIGPDTVVLPLLNGADIHDRVRGVLKTGVVLPGGIYISSTVIEPGLVAQAGGKGNLFLGKDPGRPDFDQASFLALLGRAGIPYDWQDDPFPAIWAKYLFIAGFGLVTGLSGKTIGEVIADPELAATVRGIQGEAAALARATGVKLPEDAAEAAFEKGKAFPPATKTSFQRDLAQSGKPHEGDLFGGTILRLAKETGLPAPTAARVYDAILARKAAR